MHNPLIPGFHPDPSIVKVGGDYYLATSTFEYLPGIPIFHSTDMETFRLLSHVAVRDGQLGVEKVRTSGGAWAPTIRFHDNRYWLVVADMMGGRGNLLFTADSPAGPWSDGIVMGVQGIDPDIAWDDDGTCYITMSGLIVNDDGTTSHQGITQVTLDTATGTPTSPVRSLWSGTGGMFPEAPHLYHIGDWWYLLIAEGGTERGHAMSIARATSPAGPFEGAPHNPVLTSRGTDRPVQNTGHGDLVRLPDGSWACVLLGTRPRSTTRAFAPMGRETFCSTVTWDDDSWPHLAPVQLSPEPAPVERHIEFPSTSLAALDGFDGELIGVRRFPHQIADLDARPGWARLAGRGVGMEDPQPDFLGIRQDTEACELTAVLDLSHGVGGLSVRYDEQFHFDLEVDGPAVTASMHLPSLTQSWTRHRKDAGPVRLRLVAERPAFGRARIDASCDRIHALIHDGEEWVTLAAVDGRFLSAETCESFTGRVMGPYARRGIVDVRTIHYEGQDLAR